ncbi:MAG TPA: ABC transporter ATP-binding protein [Phycisphaerae bacterium]|nr:ABC transporter ATP-binding protein [Phycisphaerae bacterium]
MEKGSTLDVSQDTVSTLPAPTAGPDRPSAELLALDRVRVAFEKLVAVRDVSFTLRGGSLLGLIGPNGAGKTTLLRAIASLQPISSGTISVLGERIHPGHEEAARMIGFTPDVPPLYDRLTVKQFLHFIAAGYGLTAEDTGPAIGFWLEKVWLTDKANQKIKGLSRGMKQRLGIARTLLPNPQIILLDEPAAGLDPAGRAQFRKLLSDLRDQGKTLIVSSHILSDMEEYCTHIAIMSHGSIVQFGTVQQISAGVDDGRCTYTIVLAEPVTGIAQLLEELPEVSDVNAERLQVTLRYSHDRARAAQLLAMLVQRGVPVAGFSANAAGLEEAYLRTGIRQVD